MTDKEALNQALEALENNQYLVADHKRHAYVMEYNSIIEKCKEALAQPTSGDYALGYAEGFNDACKPMAQLEQEPVAQEPFGYFQYDIRLDAWVQNRINNKGVAFYTKEQA